MFFGTSAYAQDIMIGPSNAPCAIMHCESSATKGVDTLIYIKGCGRLTVWTVVCEEHYRKLKELS